MRLRISEYSSQEGIGDDAGKIVITANAGFDLRTLSDTADDIPELIKESIRLIIDETHPTAFTSSMTKSNIFDARINESDNNKFDVLFLKSSFSKWVSGDRFTIEVDFGETNNMIFSTLTWKGDVFNS